MSETWHFWDSGPGAPAENMANDEALLETVAQLGAPVLRFYAWSEPAATFGYFQKYAEVERWTPLRPLLRRPTGGGVVPHAGDWTYSLVFPPAHAWFALRAWDSYERVHQWVLASFAALGFPAELSASCRPKGAPEQCFVGAEKFDVLWRGKKIAGAAQRRTRAGLLIQGSVQPPAPSLRRQEWHDAFCAVARSHAGVAWRSLILPESFARISHKLAVEKYSAAGYNRRR